MLVHMEPQPAGYCGGVRGAPGIGPPRYHLSARKMWMVRGYGVATSCGPGDVCDRRCRIFEVERVNHMHGREGAPQWWRVGPVKKYPPSPARGCGGAARGREAHGTLRRGGAAWGRLRRFFSMGRVHQMYGRDGGVRGQRVRPKKSARPVRFWSRVAPGGGGAASWEIPPPRVATG